MVRVLLLLAVFLVALPVRAETWPFRLEGGQVVFDVTVNGQRVPALLDTGASISLIELGLAKELGIRTQKIRGSRTVGVGGADVAYGRTDGVSIDLGAGPVRRHIGTYPAGVDFAGDGVRLVIGMDFLDDLVVSLDFQAMTVAFERSAKFVAPRTAPLNLTRQGWRRSTLSVELAGVEAELLLDTAASVALHLNAAFLADAPALRALPASRQMITGIDGVREHHAMVVPRVVLGGRVFENVPASAGSMTQLRTSNDIDGVVGVELLKHFDVVIDFGRHRVWMTRRS